jgi:NAD(P)-dependent dehydrogenase (short-subunit alcohol dehydrogenase family)
VPRHGRRGGQALGRLDILINNAGMNVRKQPQDFTLDEWQLVMDTNLTSAFVAAQTAYPHMKKAGGGKIVNIGSMMSIFGASFTTAYAASKGGIVQMTRASPPPGRATTSRSTRCSPAGSTPPSRAARALT